MSVDTQPPDTDLIIPLPGEGQVWDPHTVHTHYFGFCVPEAEIGVFLYIRYMPYFPLCQGGVLAFQGLENLATTDAVFHDYEITMPWPEIDGGRITTANGLSFDFVEPGRRAVLRYRSSDGRTSFDVEASAVTPLLARGHVIPGEELHQSQDPSGSEQFMHCTGTLTLHGEQYAVDSFYPRDHSWRQVRRESRDANAHPPVSWTPIHLGDDLTFNQVGIEAPDTDPDWAGVYQVPAGTPNHHFAWVVRNGQIRRIDDVRRTVTKTHPLLFAPLAMQIEATDEAGESYAFSGEAIALSPIMMWPNIAAFDSVFRWRDTCGRVAFSTVQTMHGQAYANALKTRRAATSELLR
jgi:hypothetical protein